MTWILLICTFPWDASAPDCSGSRLRTLQAMTEAQCKSMMTLLPTPTRSLDRLQVAGCMSPDGVITWQERRK